MRPVFTIAATVLALGPLAPSLDASAPAGVSLGASTAWASSAARVYSPSTQQLRRLAHLEPYIRYFTSLAYGPDDSRVSPDYIRALILTESSGHIMARSPKGARGLTQIIPSTARTAVRKLAKLGYDFLYIDENVFSDFHAEDLYDPALNILIACFLSATYHAWYEGSTDLVVSAWNAGPGAVARYGYAVPPFAETRGMIIRLKGIMSYLGERGIGQGDVN